MDDPQHLLYIAKSYLQSISPHTAAIDSDATALQNALKGLGELGLLALRVPSRWGVEVSEETFYSFQELVARYSGALAFLQTQHQSAAAMLALSRNEFLQQEYLPRLGSGQVLVGVGFSHIRRGGEPLVVAVPVTGGYQLSGHVPWITGFELFQEFIVAATLPDGQAVFGVVPFVETDRDELGSITFSQPLSLAAMMSTNTVTATLTDWFLPQERVVSVKPAGWIHENDKKNVLNATGLVLGCARAGLDILQATYSTKRHSFIAQAFAALERELIECRTAIMQAFHGDTVEKRLQLRAWAIDLAVRCAYSAVTVSSGAANYRDNAAQRVYREALVFTVSGQTTAIMEATLARLVRSGFDAVVR